MPQRLDELLQDCTVKITVPGGWGTGFFIAPGLILTCDHVVKVLEGDARAQIDWQQRSFAEAAVVERRPQVDLALLQYSSLPDVEVPCVCLGETFQPQDDLYTYGYPDSFPQGTSVTGVCEGSATENGSELLVFKLAQVRPGLSGAPLLNWRTGRVCGMVKFTRDRSIDLGGGAIPSQVILEQFPQLRDQQRQFHQNDLRWYDLVAKPEVGVDFVPYLQMLATTYEKWWTHYTLTDATGKAAQPAPEQPSIFDFGLMVQTVKKETPELEVDPSQEQREKIERLPVLEGIRKYADDHVLLVGRPGSGKSTALIRLLLEESTQALQQVKGQVPVLVELRYWNVSFEGLIQGFLQRHGLTLNDSTLFTLLGQGRFFLLIDGLNELPSESARTQLSAFRRNYPKVPMIFSTRDLGMGGDLGIEKKLEMQPLTKGQMKEFIRAYVPDQAEAMWQQLNNRLREFGQTPLLLWMLCEVFQQSPNRQMPNNLAEVFRAFTTMYEDSSVRKHEVALLKGDVRALSDRRLWKEALKALAALMMQGETPVDFRVAIHRTEAERELSKIFAKERFPVRDILDDLLKYHLLQNRTTDQLEFRHQLIQEYYAAEHLLRLLPELTDEQLKRDYLNLLKWTEPISLMLALVQDESQALRLVMLALDNVDLVLGAHLAGEVRPEFQNQLVQYIANLHTPDWLKARLLSKTRSELAITSLALMLDQKDCDIRGNILMELRYFNPNLAIPILTKVFLSDEDFDMRITAAEVLNDLGEEAKVMEALGAKLIKISDIYKTDDLSQLDTNSIQSNLDEPHDRTLEFNIFDLGLDDFYAPQIQPKNINNLFLLGIIKEALIGSMKDADVIAFVIALEDWNYSVRHDALRSLFEQESDALNQSVTDSLMQALENDSFVVRHKAAEALGAAQDDYFPNIIPHLSGLLLTSFGRESLVALTSIQDRCRFYNYEIFQAHLAAQQGGITISQPDKTIANTITIQTVEKLTIMSDKAPIFNQQNATIGVNYAAEGSQQDFTQHIHASEQNFEILLTGYEHFIDELQQQNPHVTSETAIIQTIDIEARRIDTRWQNFLNLQRLWNGGKKAAIKVGEHFVESNPWGKGAIAFLEGVSEDVK